MALTVYICERAEPLAHELGKWLAENSLVFEQDSVVVQSKSLQSWLHLELARVNGISANVAFPFPNRVMNQFLLALDDKLGDESSWPWELFTALASCSEPKVVSYLNDDDSGLKRWNLATRLADLFDQYQLYRAEELKTDSFWAAEPWQRPLFESICSPTRGQLIHQFIEHPPEQLPFKRLFFFGVTYLPPIMLDLLKAVSRQVEVVFFINGSVNESPLFRSWGGCLTEFMAQLHPLADQVIEVPCDTTGGRLIDALQGEVLSGTASAVTGVDSSLQVVSCHSQRREVEVLHQQLLALFQADASLQPEDVLILAPDPDVYFSHIDAVFSYDSVGSIPVARHVSNRADTDVIRLFFDLCRLGERRFNVTEMSGYCMHPLIREKFGIGSNESALIQQLLKEVHFCWGLDGDDKQQRFSLPPVEAHTLRFALDRLVLGLALDDESGLFNDSILPMNHIVGSRAKAASDLWKVDSVLRETVAQSGQFNELNTAAEKARFFRDILSRFIPENPQACPQWALLDRVIGDVQSRMPDETSLSVVLTALKSAATARSADKASLSFSGGVSVGSIQDAGGVPFRVVAVLGLNDGEFPRKDAVCSFDLMASGASKSGDRSNVLRDRDGFRKSVLAAQSNLLLSYVGKSMKHTLKEAPAVPLSELIDYVTHCCAEWAPVEHPMQSFSPHYFSADHEGLHSFSALNFEMAQELVRNDAVSLHRFAEPIDVETSRVLTPAELVSFFADPPKRYIEETLRARGLRSVESPPETEPFGLDALAAYGVRERTIELLADEGLQNKIPQVLEAEGLLPSGALGRHLYETEIQPDVFPLFHKLAELGYSFSLDELPVVDLTMGEWRICGATLQRCPDRIVWWRPGKLAGKYMIHVWIHHLIAMCAGVDQPTLMLGIDPKDGVYCRKFSVLSPEIAEPLLLDLLKLYEAGLRQPVSFFPKTAYEYVDTCDADKAKQKWEDGMNFQTYESYPGENAAGMNTLIYQGVLPADWAAVSAQVMQPMMDALES